MLYHTATRMKDKHHLDFVVKYIATGKITTEVQLTTALDYIKHHHVDNVNVKEFEKESGVGIVVTPEEIEDVVSLSLLKYRDECL